MGYMCLKAIKLLVNRSEDLPAEKGGSSQIIVSLSCLLGRLYIHALFGCHDILMLSRSAVKSRKRPNMTISVDWDAKPLIKQTIVPFSNIRACSSDKADCIF